MRNRQRQGGLWLAVVAGLVLMAAAPMAWAGPELTFQATDLGGGLTGYDFAIANDDGLLMSYTVAIVIQSVDGATINQIKVGGLLDVNSESQATSWNGFGDPPYDKPRDTWACSPFGDNPVLGTDVKTGESFTGMVEGENSYAISCYSGPGSQLGDGVPLAQVVCGGDVTWYGVIRRDEVAHGVMGTTQPPEAIPGDYTGNGVVDMADYATWAANFGQNESALAPGSCSGNGVVDTVEYTIWADHFGDVAPPVKTYTHLPTMDPEWIVTETFDALEPADFDAYWTAQLAALPAADGNWDGGLIDIGGGVFGDGLVDWNGATPASPKPCLVMLPPARTAPGLGICPSNDNFILASAMGIGNSYRGGTALGDGEFTEAILAVQQMIRNIKASGKCNGDIYVIGNSRGGGMTLITVGLLPDVKNFYAAVPAMTGFTGIGGTEGAWPGYPSNTEAGYLDALNHAKRITCPGTFFISYDDNVTWGRGQVSATRNVQGDVIVIQGWTGHGGRWWNHGTAWVNSLEIAPMTLSVTAEQSVAPADQTPKVKGAASRAEKLRAARARLRDIRRSR